MINDRAVKGFTLIELLIVMGLLAIVLSAVYGLLANANMNRASQDRVVELQQNVRFAADFVTREFKASSTIACLENTTTPCLTAGDKITFTSVTDAQTRIFSWSSTDHILQFSISSGAPNRQPLADNITEFTVTPYDSSNNVTTNVSSIKRIDVTITGRTAVIDPVSKSYRTYSVTASAIKRN